MGRFAILMLGAIFGWFLSGKVIPSRHKGIDPRDSVNVWNAGINHGLMEHLKYYPVIVIDPTKKSHEKN